MALQTSDRISAVLTRFGDEQSTLLDQCERLSFEVQLNRAILGRSYSEPDWLARSQVPPPPSYLHQQAKDALMRRRRGLGFSKVLKKLLKPILGGRKKESKLQRPVVREAEEEQSISWNKLNRSLRI